MMKKLLAISLAVVMVFAFCVVSYGAENLISKDAKLNSEDWTYSGGVLKNLKDDVENFTIFEELPIKEGDTYVYKGTVNYKSTRGEPWMGGRVIFRMSAVDEFLCFAMFASGDLMILQRDPVATWVTIETTNRPIELNKDYNFEIISAPTKVTIKFNGEQVLEKEVPQMKANVGMYSVNSFFEMKNLELTIPGSGDAPAKETAAETPAKETTTEGTKETTAANPKTADASVAMYIVLAAGAAGGMLTRRLRK